MYLFSKLSKSKRAAKSIALGFMLLCAPVSLNAEAVADSITDAAASILGTALKGSIENIEKLGIQLDRPALVSRLIDIVDGAAPAYSYEDAYRIIDNHVASLQNAYIDSVFSVDNQRKFVEAAAAEDGAVTTPSGLVFRPIVEGEGVTPVSGDNVKLSYVGKFSDGSVFDSTDNPVIFDVDRLVPGFTEALKMMRPGGRYRIVIPATIGYGDKGIPGEIPPNAALDFLIELLQVIPTPSGTK